MAGNRIPVWSRRISRKGALIALVLLALVGALAVWIYIRNASGTSAATGSTAKNGAEVATVQVALPERRELTRQISLPASVEAFEETTLYAKISGYLKSIKVDIGDRVRKGEAVAEIDVPELASEYAGAGAEVERAEANIGNLEAELERARAELALKKITYERLKGIRDQEPDVMPQQQVDEAKAQYDVARATLSVAQSKIKMGRSEIARAEAARDRLAALKQYATIRAPFDGVVIKRHVDPGALIQQASSQTNVSAVVTVARVDTVRVFVDVNEPEVRFIKRGDRVSVTVDALPGRVFEGKATRYASALDPKTRTMRTEIDIPNLSGELRPGMYGNVKLAIERRDVALTVPASVLIAEAGKSFVYTVVDSMAKRLEVKTGLDDGLRVEITEGLRGDEPLVVSGKSVIRDGMPVKMTAAP